MTDNIFKLFLDGDPDGIRPIYLVCAGPLIGYGLRFIPREEIVADIVTDAILLLRNHIGEFENGDRVLSWLYTTVRNKCWNELRERRLFTHLPEGAEPQSDLDTIQSIDYKDYEVFIRRIIKLIREELPRLPPKRSLDFHAYYFELKSIEQIAKERGVSKVTVEDNVTHALKAIKKYLKSKGLAI
jgi:RNA polymerase sigma factor (sigma-70 family)